MSEKPSLCEYRWYTLSTQGGRAFLTPKHSIPGTNYASKQIAYAFSSLEDAEKAGEEYAAQIKEMERTHRFAGSKLPDLRSATIRLAATLPKGSPERKALLDVLAVRSDDPMERIKRVLHIDHIREGATFNDPLQGRIHRVTPNSVEIAFDHDADAYDAKKSLDSATGPGPEKVALLIVKV